MPSDSRLTKLYNKFNNDLFDSELPHSRTHDFSLVVSNRMSRTLGLVAWTSNPKKPTNSLRISGKLMEVRVDGTPSIELGEPLLHEMCHLLMNVRDGHAGAAHGGRWKKAWIEIGQKYDALYNPPFGSMAKVAKDQCYIRYASHGENHQRAIAASGRPKKWFISCPSCGWEMNANRMGKTIKRAVTTEGIVRHGRGCTCKLVAVQMR